MADKLFGKAMKRVEDPRFITGTGNYTDDMTLPGMVHAAMVRSPYAHARIKKIDVSKARSYPGVLAVITRPGNERRRDQRHSYWLAAPRHQNPAPLRHYL
ncbi:MAG: hypothetical protein KatS3mg072_2647 [Meiothermus sp.]|nr:MAG: hypothetical protein KatS3mg072_2647 [Meiothermus sp.]